MRTILALLLTVNLVWAEPPEIIPIGEPERAQVAARWESFLKLVPEMKPRGLSGDTLEKVQQAISDRNTKQWQELLDAHTLAIVNINPEGRVKLQRGPAELPLKENQTSTILIKIVNLSGGQARLDLHTHYSGGKASPFQMSLSPGDLSGVIVEYQILKVRCSEAGKREITISIQAGQGTQDLGFRGELPLLFTIQK